MSFPVSLVIPVFNESETIERLITTIKNQSFQPEEIILVDGGSTDNTVQIIKTVTEKDSSFRLIEAGRAMPGKGRNIGAEKATNSWIAFTDAGIELDKHWMEFLVKEVRENSEPDIVYGNYSPQINSFFDKCATITYVPALQPGKIRTKSIVSCLLKKEVWKKAGGFPDWRATEDLVFMEKAEKSGCNIAFAPDAMVYWQLRPGMSSTYKKFELYSKYNVWAGRQAYWHYGVTKQYLVAMVFIVLSIIHSWYWVLLLPVWMIARVTKRILSHRYEFGVKILFNPVIVFMVALITMVIDAATFSGWIKALLYKKGYRKLSVQE